MTEPATTFPPTPAFVRDLLSSDGQGRPGDENLTGLGAALLALGNETIRMDVSAALWTYADERLAVAVEAETRAKYLPPEQFRVNNLITAERLARLWREVCHVR